MRVFTNKKSYKIILWAIIILFYLAAIFGLVYFARGGIKNYLAYGALVFLFFLVPVFLTIMAVFSLSSYFVFYDDYFEYHKMKKTIRIKAQNIRYFYFRDGMLTIYFVKDRIEDFAASFFKERLVPENSEERGLALPEDKEIYKIIIGIGMIKDCELIVNWFAENIPPLPDGQALKDIVNIINKYNNPEPEDVNRILAKAQMYASIINWASVIIAVWCALYPHPYRLTVDLNLVFPLMLLFVLHFSDGWIRFDKKGNSLYPTACLGIIAPMFGLLLRMIEDYTFVSYSSFMKAGFIFYVIYLILFLICQKEFSFKDKYTYPVLLLYSLFFFGYALGAVAAINCVFDWSEPFEEMIENNKEMVTVMMHKGLLGLKWY